MTAIVILNYNNVEDTINCIESVQQYNTAEVTYFVVDNGSTRKESVPYLQKGMERIFGQDFQVLIEDYTGDDFKYANLIPSLSNDGYARGNNKALKMIFASTRFDNVMILNNDVLFVEDIIPSLICKLEELPNCGIVSPILYHRNMVGIDYNCARKNHRDVDFLWIYLLLKRNLFGYEKKEADKRHVLKNTAEYERKDAIEIEMPSGSCMLMRTDLFREIGGFDPNTFLYFEENILHKKMQTLGFKNYLIPSLKCIHLGGMSTGKSSSYFVNVKGLESAWYYATHYTALNKLQLSLLYASIQLNKLILNITKLVKK